MKRKNRFWAKVVCLLMVAALLPVLPLSASVTYRMVTYLTSGENYMFSISGITPTGGTAMDCAVKGVVTGSSGARGLEYAARPSDGSAPDNLLWTVTAYGVGTYSLRSVSAGKYLNLTASEAYLSDTPQGLLLTSNGGKYTISATIGGTEYFLRFTNVNGSRWYVGTVSTSGVFSIYSDAEPDMTEYNNAGQTPLYTVACFSDLHVDYGIQSWTTPIRQGTIHAAQIAQQLGGADVVLVGGDITSTNGQNTWTNALITKAKQTVYDTLAPVSHTGKVLFVAGNHDYQAGYRAGGTMDSGDYTSFMTTACGAFEDTYYKQIDGVNSLLGYRYELGGIQFIGINSPYYIGTQEGTTWKSYAQSWLYESQIDWLSDQLALIGPDETAVVLCHYPERGVATRDPNDINNSTPVSSNPARSKLLALLENYPNVIYCYGHEHGDDSMYAWYTTSELVASRGAVSLGNNTALTSSYISAHMGSMGFYKNQFQPDWLSADEPQIVQFLLIDFYEDHITFRRINTGEKSADPDYYQIASYTVMRDLSAQLGNGEISNNAQFLTITKTDGTQVMLNAEQPTTTGAAFDPAAGTLTLNGLNAKRIDVPFGDLTVVLRGTNTLTDSTAVSASSDSGTITSGNGTLTFAGDGTLNVTSKGFNIYTAAGKVVFTDQAKVNLTKTESLAAAAAIYAPSSNTVAAVTFSGQSDVHITSQNCGILLAAYSAGYGTVTVTDSCRVTLDATVTTNWQSGAFAAHWIISGGTLNAAATAPSVQSLSAISAQVNATSGTNNRADRTASFVMTGGNVTLTATSNNASPRPQGLFTNYADLISITGGTLNLNAAAPSGTAPGTSSNGQIAIQWNNAADQQTTPTQVIVGGTAEINVTAGKSGGLFVISNQSTRADITISGGTIIGTDTTFARDYNSKASTLSITGGDIDWTSTSKNLNGVTGSASVTFTDGGLGSSDTRILTGEWIPQKFVQQISLDANDPHTGGASSSDAFSIAGVQLRVSEPTGIRFVVRLSKDLETELKTRFGEGNVSFGVILQRKDTADYELTEADVVSGVSLGNGSAVLVPREVDFSVRDNYLYYTAVISNMPPENYSTAVTARAYVKCGDTYYFASEPAGATYSVSGAVSCGKGYCLSLLDAARYLKDDPAVAALYGAYLD